jgi:hypothetical protein
MVRGCFKEEASIMSHSCPVTLGLNVTVERDAVRAPAAASSSLDMCGCCICVCSTALLIAELLPAALTARPNARSFIKTGAIFLVCLISRCEGRTPSSTSGELSPPSCQLASWNASCGSILSQTDGSVPVRYLETEHNSVHRRDCGIGLLLGHTFMSHYCSSTAKNSQ